MVQSDGGKRKASHEVEDDVREASVRVELRDLVREASRVDQSFEGEVV